MNAQPDTPVIGALMEWCFERGPEAVARQERVPKLLDEFGDLFPRNVPIVTVAGTSGKGTTCAMLEAVLADGGHVTGVYSKPHLVSFRERFRVAGRDVSDPELAAHAAPIFERLKAFVARHGREFRPTLYEGLILIAASIFARRGVTVAVYEASVGGASCPTSFLPSALSVLTSVDLDHQLELGFRLEDIARDKAGIAPRGSTLVVGAGTATAARTVVRAECAERGVRVVEADEGGVETLSTTVAGQVVRYDPGTGPRAVFVPFPGRHQARNFATVLKAAQVLHESGCLSSPDAVRGVARAKVRGRFEFVPGAPSWLLDVAHNPASVESLIDTAHQVLPDATFVVIVGATGRHDHREIVNVLGRRGLPLGFCEGFPRALPARQLLDGLSTINEILGLFDTPAGAVGHCATAAPLRAATVIITGSLFLVGECRQELARRGLLPEET